MAADTQQNASRMSSSAVSVGTSSSSLKKPATATVSSGHVESIDKGKEPKEVHIRGGSKTNRSASQSGILIEQFGFTQHVTTRDKKPDEHGHRGWTTRCLWWCVEVIFTNTDAGTRGP